MKTRYLACLIMVFMCLIGCSNYLGGDDRDMSFNDQLRAFEHPAPLPDDQMPSEYDASLSDSYHAMTRNDPIYPSNSDYFADESPRSSTSNFSSGSGDSLEVPFSATRRVKTANVGGGNL